LLSRFVTVEAYKTLDIEKKCECNLEGKKTSIVQTQVLSVAKCSQVPIIGRYF